MLHCSQSQHQLEAQLYDKESTILPLSKASMLHKTFISTFTATESHHPAFPASPTLLYDEKVEVQHESGTAVHLPRACLSILSPLALSAHSLYSSSILTDSLTTICVELVNLSLSTPIRVGLFCLLNTKINDDTYVSKRCSNEVSMSSIQREAVDYIREKAKFDSQQKRDEAINRIESIRSCTTTEASTLLDLITAYTCTEVDILIHFEHHLLGTLTSDSHYRNCFEIPDSNRYDCVLDETCQRYQCESQLFNSKYDGRPACEKPKYGELNYLNAKNGNQPNAGNGGYGRVALKLKNTIKQRERITLTSTDSFDTNCAAGTLDEFIHIFVTFNDEEIKSICDIVTGTNKIGSYERCQSSKYVEAQIHSDIILSRDVESVIVNESIRIEAEENVKLFAETHGLRVEWTPD